MSFDTIKPFISLGWHTVPLEGELSRLKNGKKTIPIFEKNWLSNYTKTKNTTHSKIGGVITGICSGIIALDCDNAATYKIFRDLDPTYRAVFVSVGKGGGTIIYSLPTTNKDISKSFKLATNKDSDNSIRLDFFSTNGFIYLPTISNTTKKAWVEIPIFKEPPSSIILLLNTLLQHSLIGVGNVAKNYGETQQHNFNLAPMLQVFITKKKFYPDLFKLLTPLSFRSLPQYVEENFLHPKNVPDGRGSEYLVCISAILGSDSSVNEELYTSSMLLINSLWENPMPGDRLDSTIIEPMLDKKSFIDGKPIWKFNKNWVTEGFYVENKKNEVLEIFFDDHAQLYYIVNQSTGTFKAYNRTSDCFAVLDVVSLLIIKKITLVRKAPLIVASIKPHLASGMYVVDTANGPKKAFNLFRQSKAINIINNPEQWDSSYNKPENIINFFNSLIPDKHTRNYILGFLKTKFTSFSYSPVVLYFLGISGSGKDTFVELINRIMGEEYEYIARPSAKVFLEKHNGWLRNIFFAQLDEYGDQLLTVASKREATGKIKTYTGSPKIQMRRMHTDGESIDHSITFIMTANTNPLTLDDNDRRITFINTPNILKDEKWVVDGGGMSKVRNNMYDELYDFCYYLATEVEGLSEDDYTTPPENPEKLSLIASSLISSDQLVFCLLNNLVSELQDMVVIAGYSPFVDCRSDGVSETDLYSLLSGYDPDNSSRKMLNLALRKYNVPRQPTTKNGVKDYFCTLPIHQDLRNKTKNELVTEEKTNSYDSLVDKDGNLPSLNDPGELYK